jgi:hypothetical protein
MVARMGRAVRRATIHPEGLDFGAEPRRHTPETPRLQAGQSDSRFERSPAGLRVGGVKIHRHGTGWRWLEASTTR